MKEYKGHKIFNTNGYPSIYLPNHHLANGTGYVYIHRLVAEENLGRELLDSEHVHHKDENKQNYNADNLMVFKTGADHTSYHAGSKIVLEGDVWVALDKYISYRDKNGKIIDKKNKCPYCDNLKSAYSSMCEECSVKMRREKSKCPSKEILEELIEKYPYTYIAKMYEVSDKAVANWCKRLGIYISKAPRREAPNKEELINLLLTNSINKLSTYYNVSADTINTWINKYNIIIENEKVMCKETKEIFNSYKEAIINKYPEMNIEVGSSHISEIIDTNIKYKDYSWSKIKRTVYCK